MSTEKGDWFFLKVALGAAGTFWLFTIASAILYLLTKSGNLMAPRAGGITIHLAYLSLVFLYSSGANYGVGSEEEKRNLSLLLALVVAVLWAVVSSVFGGVFLFPLSREATCLSGVLVVLSPRVFPRGGLSSG